MIGRVARRAVVAVIVAGLAVGVGACGGGRDRAVAAEAAVPEPPPEALVKEQDAGPAAITIHIWPATPTLGASIWLRLEVTAKPGVTVDLPFEQGALGRFAVQRYVTDTTRTDDGGARRVDTYELAAPMSGRHRIPPFRLVLHDDRPAAPDAPAAGPTEVLTEEIPLEVGAVLADRTDRALRAAPGALPLTVGEVRPWPAVIAGGLGVLALIAGLLAWRALRRRAVRRSQEGAWDRAMRRLAELEARGAPGADEADGWFVELSSVVRRYVEGRFRLRAPELTTEEFLGEARRLAELATADRELLGRFLAQCDQVKFAGYRPGEDESLGVLQLARGFVRDTRPRDEASAPAQEVADVVVA